MIDQMQLLLSKLGQNPQALEKFAQALAQRGAVPPSMEQLNALQQQLAMRRRQVPPQAASPNPVQQPMAPTPRAQTPMAPVVNPQQAQAVNQQLGIVKGQNPYLMR